MFEFCNFYKCIQVCCVECLCVCVSISQYIFCLLPTWLLFKIIFKKKHFYRRKEKKNEETPNIVLINC